MNKYLTLDNISETLRIPRRTLARIVSNLKEKGILKRSESKKTGYWEIIK